MTERPCPCKSGFSDPYDVPEMKQQAQHPEEAELEENALGIDFEEQWRCQVCGQRWYVKVYEQTFVRYVSDLRALSDNEPDSIPILD